MQTAIQFYTSVHLRGNKIFIRGFDNKGERVKESFPIQPFLFIPSKIGNTEYRTLHGHLVDRIDFDSISSAREFIEQYKEISNFKIYGMTNFVYPYINDQFQGDINYDPHLINVGIIDIETDSEGGFPNIEEADKEITAITLRKNDQILVFGRRAYKPTKNNVTYFQANSERQMLEDFIKHWTLLDLDVITGWNIETFDVPYIVNRIKRLLGPAAATKLSPWNILEEREFEIFGKVVTTYMPMGVAVLDYLALYKKFSYSGQQESYSLDYIAKKEIDRGKVDYSEFESLHDLYVKDFKKFIDYNIHDVELVVAIDDKLKFLEQVYAIAYDAKVNYNDTFTSVRMWDVIIHNYLLKQKIVIPNTFARFTKNEPIVGAYVKDPRPGMYKWVVSFDLDSLYPHLIMQYNISPDTFRDKDENIEIETLLNKLLDEKTINRLKSENLTVAASGCFFDRDIQGFLPHLMEEMYADRVKFKKQMIEAKKRYEADPSYENKKEVARNHNMQQAKKVQLNSVYGALSNIYFRWFDIDLAESITKSGQLSIRRIEAAINAYMNRVLKTENVDYVIACDTDSMYVNFEKLVERVYGEKASTETVVDFLDRISKDTISKVIEETFNDLALYVNAYAQKMRMKREGIANKGIWTGKKHYVLNVYDLEGVRYKEPQLKIMGIEAIRSSTPSSCRETIKETLKLIMNGTEQEVIDFIEKYREKFFSLPFEAVAFPRSVSGLFEGQKTDREGRLLKQGYASSSSVYIKGTPIATKGSLVYNNMLKRTGLDKKLPVIHEGDKIKYAYLKTPNPANCTVIATPGTLPPQLGLEKYIDYNAQFETGYLEPMRKILNAIGWSVEKRSTLEGFFA